jgi:hypothetical protein
LEYELDIVLHTKLSVAEVSERLANPAKRPKSTGSIGASSSRLLGGYPEILATVDGSSFRLERHRHSGVALLPIFQGEFAASEGGGTTIQGNCALKRRVGSTLFMLLLSGAVILWLVMGSCHGAPVVLTPLLLWVVMFAFVGASGWLAAKREEENVKRFLMDALDAEMD